MPVKRTLAKGRRLDDYKREQLLIGPEQCLIAGVGYLAGCTAGTFDDLDPAEQAEVLAEMKRDWQHSRGELMVWWNAGENAPLFSSKPWIFPSPGSPDRLPWAAQQFDNENAR